MVARMFILSTRAAFSAWRDTILLILFYGAVAIAFLSPMASDTVLPSDVDYAQLTALIVQARMALEERQFPLRIAPWQYNGWGYPTFQFYSQLPYTFAGAAYKWLTPTNPFVAFKLTVWLSLVLAGFFTYKLARRLTGSGPAALLSGMIYMASPYFLININARAAFAETVAQGLVPLVIYSSLRCYSSHHVRWVSIAAISWSMLAITHVITFAYTSVFVGAMFLIRGVFTKKRLIRTARLGSAYGLGCLCSAYFLLPVLLTDYLRIRVNLWDPFWTRWFTPLPALLAPASVPPEPLPGRLTVQFLHPAVGWPVLLAFGAVAYLLISGPLPGQARISRTQTTG